METVAGPLVGTRPMLALKEWGAVVHALLAGRQRILLRKGGIHEKAFDAHAEQTDPVLLYPTVAHTHAERTRPEHHDLLAAAERDTTDDHVVLHAAIRIHGVVEVRDPGRVGELSDLHIWTDESIRSDRIEFRPKHPLQIMVVQTLPLAAPVVLPRQESHGGCRSWIDVEPPALRLTEASASLPEELDALLDRVRDTVGHA